MMNAQDVKIFLNKSGKICLRCHREIQNAELGMRASSLTFTTVSSIAPLLAISFYVFKLLGGFEKAYAKLVPFLIENLSEGSGETVANYLSTFIQNVHSKTIGWVGVAGLFFTAITTYLSISGSFQKIWSTSTIPSLKTRLLRAVLLITLGPILISISITLSAILASQLKIIPYFGYLLSLSIDMVLYTLIYSLLPPIRLPLKKILYGSLLPSILWELAKHYYTFYTIKVIDYSKFYGSLASIPLFLFWVYIAWYITLFGAVWVKTLNSKE